MKMLRTIAPLFVLILFVLGSCGFGKTANKAEPVGTQFFELLKQRDYDGIVPLLDDVIAKEDMLSVLEAKEVLGELREAKKKMGFHTSINNGTTTVELNYKCTYENAVTDESLSFKQVGDKFLIYGYEYKARK